jgi:hypothetical protein
MTKSVGAGIITAKHLGQLVAGDNELVFGDRLAQVDARLAHAPPRDTNEAVRASTGIEGGWIHRWCLDRMMR